MSSHTPPPPLPSPEDSTLDRKGTSSRKMQGRAGEYLGKDVIPLWVADMDFRSPKPVIDALVERAAHGVYGYTDAPAELGGLFCGRLTSIYGCAAPDPEWVKWLPGLLPGLNHAVRAFCRKPTDAVVVPTPIYAPFLSAPFNCDRPLLKPALAEERVDGGSTLRYSIDWAATEEALAKPEAKVLLWCNPQNPVGRCWSRDEMGRLARLCVQHDVVLLSDEACDLRSRDTCLPACLPVCAGLRRSRELT